MKNTPKKVFILENGNYKELSYEDFCSFKENDISYADKLFIPLHGMLMEVTEETYRNFYKSKRRQKYIDERSAENNDFSYDMLTTDDCNGVQREHNKKLNNGLPILHKVPPKRDYGRYFCIMAEKGGTSHGGLTEKLSPFFHAKKQEVNAYGR